MENAINVPIKELTKLRKEIHKNPELSGKENNTAKRIISFAKSFHPNRIIQNIGGKGIAVIFYGKEKGPTVLIRCELDALPISETNKFKHRSTKTNVSHKCGHDGHMAIVSGLIPLLSKRKIKKGKVALLYQPAEETGEGAEKVVNDTKFNSINPDFVFALHNIPGFEKGKIMLRENEFAAASKGMIIKLYGKTSHAAEPENGRNPALAISELISSLNSLPQRIKGIKDYSLVTIIHSIIGERAFGTSPGYAELMLTLRTFKNEDMKLLTRQAIKRVYNISGRNKLKCTIEFTEEFPATVNDKRCIELIKKASIENNLKIGSLTKPFRWSEDFGHFTNKFKGALFGLGSGKSHPSLHNSDYDFPDEIIVPGVKVFYSIINQILN